jgi:hypothetical protein
MDEHGAKSEFHSRVDCNFDEANINNYIVGTSDTIVDGDGYRLTSVAQPVGFIRSLLQQQDSGVSSIFSLGNADVDERQPRRDQMFTDWIQRLRSF